MLARALPFAFASLLAVGCSKPQPPKITPVGAKITGVVPNGVDVKVKLRAHNPNGFDVPVQSVTAHVIVDGTRDLGTFTIPEPINLVSHKNTVFEVPVEVRWSDMLGLAQLAMSGRNVDYVVSGDVELGGDMMSVKVPYKIAGTVTHSELQKAAGKALPKGIHIPGL